MSGNQAMDQQFDDDLLLALQMSMQPQNDVQPPHTPPVTSEAAVEPTPMDTEEASSEPTPLVEQADAVAPAPVAGAAAGAAAASTEETQEAPPPASAAVPAVKKAKKRVKKNKYKDLIATVTQSTRTQEEDRAVFAANLKKSTGGGTFTKLDKI